MKICVLNFSGNVGKSTIAAHLLQPRMNAQVFSVESLNVDASSDGVEVARLRGKHYNDLLQRLMKLDDAIVDVGSSNVEDFLKMMQHYADSQEEFDLFVVPVVKDGKQQADTVNTIRALRAIGVPAAKIQVLINKVETDDDLRTDFAGVFGFCASGEATIPEGGVIFANELFAMLKTQQLSISALNDDATSRRAFLAAAIPFLRLPDWGALIVHGGIPASMASFPDTAEEAARLTGAERDSFRKVLRTRYIEAETGKFLAAPGNHQISEIRAKITEKRKRLTAPPFLAHEQ